jgi:hypothetical protein
MLHASRPLSPTRTCQPPCSSPRGHTCGPASYPPVPTCRYPRATRTRAEPSLPSRPPLAEHRPSDAPSLAHALTRSAPHLPACLPARPPARWPPRPRLPAPRTTRRRAVPCSVSAPSAAQAARPSASRATTGTRTSRERQRRRITRGMSSVGRLQTPRLPLPLLLLLHHHHTSLSHGPRMRAEPLLILSLPHPELQTAAASSLPQAAHPRRPTRWRSGGSQNRPRSAARPPTGARLPQDDCGRS